MDITTGRLLDNQVNGDWNGEKYSLQEGSLIYTCVYMCSANSNKLRLRHSLVNVVHLFSRRYTAARVRCSRKFQCECGVRDQSFIKEGQLLFFLGI